MAEIKIALEELKEEIDSDASASDVKAAGKPAFRGRWMAVGGAAMAASAALLSLTARWREAEPAWKELPLTSYPGYQGEPSLSPDGSQFAFVWDGGDENATAQLYVSLVGRGTPLRLTNTPGAVAAYPEWSPDGQLIAFVRYAQGSPSGDLILIPTLGGPERRIAEVMQRGTPTAPRRSSAAWSPDGKWIYFAASTTNLNRCLFVVPSEGGDKRQLTNPPQGVRGDFCPAVSPDGRQLVFVREFSDLNYDLFVADLRDGIAAGTPRQLTSDGHSKGSPVWTNDGREIIYLSGEWSNLMSIYRVRASGGSPARMIGIGENPRDLAIAPKGHRLVYSRALRDYNIWRVGLPAGSSFHAGTASKILASTRLEDSPAYSPDGKRIAFSSNRTGFRQIWVAEADGSNPVALTNFALGAAGSPRWSPDGQTIVFDARPEGLADIYTVRVDGGTPRRLTDDPAEDQIPCYSADGRWIYFASGRTGRHEIFRIPSDGGKAVQITHKGGAYTPLASPDGEWIYYERGATIWRVRPDGGDETPALGGQILANTFAFSITASGIYFAGARDPVSKKTPLKHYPVGSRTGAVAP
jgi:Tol biopolymer transport system component